MIPIQATRRDPRIEVDFSRSIPPRVPELDTAVHTALEALRHQAGVGELLEKTWPGGSAASRSAGSTFLAGRLRELRNPSTVLLTNGAQNALLVLLRALVGKGGVLLAERLSYTPLKSLAAMAGVRLVGLDMDEEGVRPEAFERACQNVSPRALYCNPTVQNPTTATSSLARRHDLVRIARAFGVPLIEDDALGPLHPEAPPPLASLAPETTWYVATLTKCVAQGIRLAYVVAPGQSALERVFGPVRSLSYWHAAPLSEAVLGQMLTAGTAATVAAAIARESIEREKLARELLAGLSIRSQRGSMHVWLTLPAQLPCRRFAEAALAAGVAIRTADLFATESFAEQPNAVRLSLSAATDRNQVARGLLILRELLPSAA